MIGASNLVVVPVYNNAGTVRAVISETLQFTSHVLVVNDGSTDASAEQIASFGDRIHVLTHDKNRGKGAALLTAFYFARQNNYKALITIDADGQHKPHDLPKFFASVADNPRALVIGVRNMEEKSAGDVPSSSHFGRKFSNFWIFAETGLWLSDTQSGFRAYPVKDEIFVGLKDQRYSFEIEILVRAIWQDFPVNEIAIDVFYPERAKRVSHFDPFWDNLHLSKRHARFFLMNLITILSLGLCYRKTIRPRIHQRGGISLLHLLFRLGGVRFCYLIAFFPLVFYFLFDARSRFAMQDLYRRLTGRRKVFRPFSNFWFFGLSLIDRLGIAFNLSRLDRAIVHEGPVPIVKPGSILIGAHYGDWILCGMGMARHYKVKIALVINEAINPSFMNAIAKTARENVKILSASEMGPGLLLHAKEYLEQGYCLGFMGDRSGEKQGISLDFLGSKATFSGVPFEMARILETDIFFFTCKKTGSWPSSPYSLKISKIPFYAGIKVQDLARSYVSLLEEALHKDPAHWFNFVPIWQKP